MRKRGPSPRGAGTYIVTVGWIGGGEMVMVRRKEWALWSAGRKPFNDCWTVDLAVCMGRGGHMGHSPRSVDLCFGTFGLSDGWTTPPSQLLCNVVSLRRFGINKCPGETAMSSPWIRSGSLLQTTSSLSFSLGCFLHRRKHDPLLLQTIDQSSLAKCNSWGQDTIGHLVLFKQQCVARLHNDLGRSNIAL